MDCKGWEVYDNKWKVSLCRSPKFSSDQQPAEEEEHDNPGGGHEESPPDGVGVPHAPAPEHDVPHRLDCHGVGQQLDEGDHPGLGHPLQWPDDAAQQHVGEAGSDRELHRVSARVANGREEKSKTHSRKA